MKEQDFKRLDNSGNKKKRECMNCDNCRNAKKKRLEESTSKQMDDATFEQGLKELCGGAEE
jgi:hypothetical protein